MQFFIKAFLLLTVSAMGTLTATSVVASEERTTSGNQARDTDSAGTEQEQLGEIKIISDRAKEPPTVELLLRSSFFSSSNLTSIEDFERDNLNAREKASLGDFERSDVTFANGIFLMATPSLAPNTNLIAYGGGNFVRYGDNDSLEYNSLNLGLGLQTQFNQNMSGQLRWRHDRLYDAGNGDEIASPNDSDAFFVDNSIEASLQRRDRLGDQLSLHATYSLEGHIVNPDELSYISNELDLALRYQLSSNWNSELGYQVRLDSFTNADRTDFQQQLEGTITYRATEQFFIEGLVAYRFGNSSLEGIDPNAFRAGVRVGYDLELF